MIKPNHSIMHSWLINLYITYVLRCDFRTMVVTGNIIPQSGSSVLLIPNHFSWWDGFFAWHINRVLFKKKFHIMMLEHELSKRMFFSRVGAFSVNLKSRSVIESLKYSTEILSNPENILVLFPQGKFDSLHSFNLVFQRGVERILSNSRDVQIVFVACLTDYFAHRRPSVTLALKEYRGEIDIESLQHAYNEHLRESIHNQNNIFNL